VTNMINLFGYAVELASGLDSLYRGIRYDKARLVEFMEINDWFGISPTLRDKAPHIALDEREIFRDRLSLWLSAFKQPDNVKLNVLLCHFEAEYPQTCELYRDFLSANSLSDSPSAWKLLDCIFYNFDAEITDCDEIEIEDFIRHLDSDATRGASRMFADFLVFSGLSMWSYEFYSRERPDVGNDAYPLGDYAVMAYCIFNEEIWEQERLIEKAVNSPQFADLWLYTAMHFLCALRSTDITRLPAPKLPYSPDQTLEDITNGVFSNNLAVALTDEMVFRIEMKGLKPLKTSKYSDVPNIKLYVSESLRKPLGIIIAIALAHHTEIRPGAPFIFSADYRSMHGQFFGKYFQAAMGKRHLSVRRCNKSYLQGIEAVTDNDAPGKPKGYILAALARNHKGGIGSLPEITDIYLKDANFTGYKPEFIAAQMFERGVFSFIASALLEIYSGNDYTCLPVISQTSLILTAGLGPAQIEGIMTAAETSLQHAVSVVGELIRKREPSREQIGTALQNIASGAAPSRQPEYLCLMTAASRICPHSDRDSCLGCGYEVYTKSAMHMLMNEYVRLSMQTGADDVRAMNIITDAILPAVDEMLNAMQILYPDADDSVLLDIFERGINYVDSVYIQTIQSSEQNDVHI